MGVRVTAENLKAGLRIDLGAGTGRAEAHVFLDGDIKAIEAALLTGRPLLLKGDPGVGKSQFARAAAAALRRGFRQKVVDSATQSRDLLWDADLIERLAQAQALGSGTSVDWNNVTTALDIRRFIKPGILWWGFNPEEAWRHAETYLDMPPDETARARDLTGMVVLIDEIDKTESDVPNGLLEALGERRFTPRGYDRPIAAAQNPLVVVTSNEERPLPPAFLRRCIVHEIKLDEGAALESLLVARGKAHFPDHAGMHEVPIARAAELTVKDRNRARELGLRPLPGQAEFIDLLNAIFSEDQITQRSPEEAIDALSPFILRKHADLHE